MGLMAWKGITSPLPFKYSYLSLINIEKEFNYHDASAETSNIY
jgi:hypothetical protein